MAASIRQHADSVDMTSIGAVFGSTCLAGSLILVRLVRRESIAGPDMAAGYTVIAQAYAQGSSSNDGSVGFHYKVAAGGETNIDRNATGEMWMCTYEITGASSSDIEYVTTGNNSTANPSAAGNIVAPWGLLFSAHIVCGYDYQPQIFSGVAGASMTEIHDQAVGSASGYEKSPWLWFGNAAGAGVDINPSVTFTPGTGQAVVHTAALAVLIREAAPAVGVQAGFIG